MVRKTITLVAAVAFAAAVGPGAAITVGAEVTHHGQPACTVSLPSNSTNSTTLQLANNEVLCVAGTFTNKGTITVAAGGTAVIEAADFDNHGTVNAGSGTTLQFTNLPSNLVGTTLTGGKWIAAGTISLPGAIATIAANVTLSGGGEIEDSTDSSNAVDTLSTIRSNGTFVLNDSAYLGTGSVTSAGTVILGTKGNSGDSVNWQDSGTFTMTGGSFTFLDGNACINVGSRAFTITGGSMSGFGMLTGAVTVSGTAVFDPTLNGDQAGFWLAGTYSQTGGTFEDTVSNPSGSPNTSVLWVSGAVSLGGTLDVLSNGSRPTAGTSLQILTGSLVSGQFKSVHNAGVAGFSASTDSQSASVVTMTSSPPSAPLHPHASKKGPRSVKVSWKSPASNGGQPISSYVITPNGNCACRGLKAGPNSTGSTVSGLQRGKRYTFTVEARNAIGTSIASAATNSVR